MLKLIRLLIAILGVILLNSCSNFDLKKNPYPDTGTANERGTRIKPYNTVEVPRDPSYTGEESYED